MKHLLLVYVSQNNCFYYLSNTNTPNTVFYYLLFQIVSQKLSVFPNSPLVAKKHYLHLNSQIVKYQIAALHRAQIQMECRPNLKVCTKTKSSTKPARTGKSLRRKNKDCQLTGYHLNLGQFRSFR
jgi:hypothetical protein